MPQAVFADPRDNPFRTFYVSAYQRNGLIDTLSPRVALVTSRALVVPYWSVLAVPLVIWLAAWGTRRRFGAGRCATCGYDLTGNVSGICPECGTAVPRTAASA